MRRLNSPALRREFERKADRRGRHHARQVLEIIPVVVQAVFELADPGTVYGSLYNEVLTGRSGWASFRGRRVWGGYNSKRGQIEFREENRLGRAIARFDNDSSRAAVERQIRNFGRRRAR